MDLFTTSFKFICTLLLQMIIIMQAEIPFTNNMHELVASVCWEESVMHNTERTSHLALVIVCQGDVAPIMGQCVMC